MEVACQTPGSRGLSGGVASGLAWASARTRSLGLWTLRLLRSATTALTGSPRLTRRTTSLTILEVSGSMASTNPLPSWLEITL